MLPLRPASALCAALTLALLAACAPTPPKPAPAGPSAADLAFEALAARYLEESAGLYPVQATLRGDHRHDAELDDLSARGRELRTALATRYVAELATLAPAGMSPATRVDARLLAHALERELWDLTEFDSWRWNPLRYSELAGDALHALVSRQFAPLPQRLRAVTGRLEALPGLLAQERDALEAARVPRIHAQTAARQNAGLLTLVTEEIAPHADALEGEERARLDKALLGARTALRQQQTWLSKRLVPAARGEFRLGPERFDRQLRYVLDAAASRADVRAGAEAALARTRGAMYALAREVLLSRPNATAPPERADPQQQQVAISAALALAAADHPAREAILEAATRALAEARDAVSRRALVTLYDDPLEVQPLPAYRRGGASAACDAPGRADRGTASHYLIATLPQSVSGPEAAYYLREHNRRAILEEAIRVALPGGCLQRMHAARYGGAGAAAALRVALPAPTFVDGWEVYAGVMMAEEGAAGDDALRHLVQLKAYLRAVVDAIVEQAVHADGLAREAAMRMFTHDAFEEQSEAADDWTRVELGDGRLSAGFVGAEQLLALREEARQRWGAEFTPGRYNDSVLSVGAPPVRDVRSLIFGLAIEE